MSLLSDNHLTLRQKIRLALSIALIYWPIRVYVNISPLSWAVVGHNWPFFLAEGLLIIGLLLGWVWLMDELQERLTNRLAQTDTGELRLTTQLVTLLVAIWLALLANKLFGQLRQFSEQRLEHGFSTTGWVRDDPFDTRPDNRGQRRRMNNGLTVLALLAAFYLTANRRSTRRIHQLQIQAERQEKETVRAQFDALKNQVNPHFLFNSLSILSSLVDTEPRLAGDFINQLAKAYRYILEQQDNEQVSLGTELDFIEAYAFLLSLRFEDKLFVVIDVPPAARNRNQIAPLSLQLLVENTVKHNQLSEEEPLRVYIELAGDYLQVRNALQPRSDQGVSTGIGLRNITNRYSLLTPRPVWVGEVDGYFVVKLPLL
ncbi:histidine kinase (plasmid) [Spirosoma sp. SC4-14]|uniref:sensor histidine kinase n=1 Tax=Spirosoma sp. SC4-14 TaxID=3128900 RepID=UPI0030D00F88